jgi:hypothetical protein
MTMAKLASAKAGAKSIIPQPRNLSSKPILRQSAATSISHNHSVSTDTKIETETETKPIKPKNMAKPPPLSILPLKLLLRSIAINSISCSPILLPPSLRAMDLLANSHSAILNPDKNPILRWFLKKTFYAQFCAGENAKEVQQTISTLKHMGYKGVILGYAKEVVLDEQATKELEASGGKVMDAVIQNEILPWKKGTLETVSLAQPGDFVALKFTGAGSQALYSLTYNLHPPPELEASIIEICDLAASRNVRLVFDAEQAALQTGIDAWTLDCMRRYNAAGKAVVYCTYQAYLKACPSVLASHLTAARKEGFVAGVKLVRGAYINSDPRHLINDTKAATDAMYDGLAESLMRRSYGPILQPAKGEEGKEFPQVSLVLASHNIVSVRKAMAIRAEQGAKGQQKIELVYGQLQGMADEVSCELVQKAQTEVETPNADLPMAYKYLVWGTTGECMKYLSRRAQENKDAVQRTREGRDLMAREAVRRMKNFFGFSS